MFDMDLAPPLPTSPTPAAFKDVLAHLASGVAIVSCWDGDMPRGLLVSSITGLSAEPPRFLFCIRKEAGCHDIFLEQSRLAIALLGATDREEALRFSNGARWEERFDQNRWRLEAGAPPTYRYGVARAVCAVDTVIDAQTHSVFFVTAEHYDLEPAAPLIAWNRALLSAP